MNGAPPDADADVIPAASVVCRLLLETRQKLLPLSLTCNCFGCVVLCIPAVSSTRAGGRGAGRLLPLLHFSGATVLLLSYILFIVAVFFVVVSWGVHATTYSKVIQNGGLRDQKTTAKSAMRRFAMLCYALGHPWVALGTYLG